MKNLIFSFDIGYASIGWGVISQGNSTDIEDVDILGSGVVLFPADDCLASERRKFRGMRRNIRSRRLRILRVGKYLVDKGLISEDERATICSYAPFLLAAHALKDNKLSAHELWDVIRWYAHNRGYDGNSAWSREEEGSKEDSERVKIARQEMLNLGAETMCETVVKILHIGDFSGEREKKSSHFSYKKLNMAFPREVVIEEVRRILILQQKYHPQLTDALIAVLLDDISPEGRHYCQEVGVARIPRRYRGGLLFGQLIPRFDNRIIQSCPIAWATYFDKALAEGKTEKEAKCLADKFSKVPNKNSREFYRYRLARVIANIRADEKPLSREIRQKMMREAEEQGRLTRASLEAIIMESLGEVGTNLKNYFTLHPDSEAALVLDPALSMVKSVKADIAPYWAVLPQGAQKVFLAQLRQGKGISMHAVRAWLLVHALSTETLDAVVRSEQEKQEIKRKESEKKAPVDLWGKVWTPSALATGRAPYAREVLVQVVEEVLAGFDPSSPACSEDHPQGEDKERNGILYALNDPSSRVNAVLKERPLARLTNNHMVRHRLLIFERLLEEMVGEFAAGHADAISHVVVEVGRELSEFSGKKVKQIAADLGLRLSHFKKAVEVLEKANQERISSGIAPLTINGGLIRKCRIAQDMNWKCPFTGSPYSPDNLTTLEREHIVPYSKRKTNALSALVLTWPGVNKMKRNRTAWEFIQADQGKPVEDMPSLTIFSKEEYKKFVGALKTKGGHGDDERRREQRKKLLWVDAVVRKGSSAQCVDEKDEESQRPLAEFTEGAMTQSSHLMKLATRAVKHTLSGANVLSIPGFVTGEVRKSWNLLECLVEACPDVVEGNGVSEKAQDESLLDTSSAEGDLCREEMAGDVCLGSSDHSSGVNGGSSHKLKDKNEIRGITHLHHAVDALTLGLMTIYLPGHRNGKVWQMLGERNRNKRKSLAQDPDVARVYQLDSEQRGHVMPLSPVLKKKIAQSLAEGRVVRHIPADMSGAILEENFRGIVKIEGDFVHLRQYKDGKINETKENRLKLAGLQAEGRSAKLASIKAAIVVQGNYAVALDPQPSIIPHINVYKQLQALKKENGGKSVRLIKNGMLIRIHKHKDKKREGVWMVKSIKNNAKAVLLLDLQRPCYAIATTQKHQANWRNVYLSTLLGKNVEMEIMPFSYTGYSCS